MFIITEMTTALVHSMSAKDVIGNNAVLDGKDCCVMLSATS